MRLSVPICVAAVLTIIGMNRTEAGVLAAARTVPLALAGTIDTEPPNPVSDLRTWSGTGGRMFLQWAIPEDNGPAGIAGYDVRYSTTYIDESNWDAATPLLETPSPTPVPDWLHVELRGLTPGVPHFFAVRAYDAAEPPNVSPLSTVVVATVPPQPVVVNPWIASDRVADCRSIETIGATFGNAYSPDGVTPPADEQEKAINCYNNHKRRCYHWGQLPPNGPGVTINDPVYVMNVFGWGLCFNLGPQGSTIAHAAGLPARWIDLYSSGGSHWHAIYEVYYWGRWHVMDTMTTMYVYDRSSPRQIASCDDIKQDPTLLTQAASQGRACPGFLLCGDSASAIASNMQRWQVNPNGIVTDNWSMDMDLRAGEAFERTWESWANQHPTPGGTSDPPFHHEAHRDYKDYVNYPYWEPYAVPMAFYGGTVRDTYRRWANGTFVLQPDFTVADGNLHGTPVNIATTYDDGQAPALHVAEAGTPAEAVFRVALPFYITDATLSGTFHRAGAADAVRVLVSKDGANWTQVWSAASTGTTQVDALGLRSQMFGTFEYYIKIEMQASAAGTDVGVDDLVISTVFEHNKGAMAYLDKGTNHLTVTFDDPVDLAAGGHALQVTYQWSEYDGSGWNVLRQRQELITGSPHTFTIDVGGSKVPRTESVRMEVVPSTSGDVAPLQISDLRVMQASPDSVTLAWTATGQAGQSGQATAYDLRRATEPITPTAWETVATVAGLPAPQPAFGAEQFVVTGLTSGAEYFFAIRAENQAGTLSDLSNIVRLVMPHDPPADINGDGTVNVIDLLSLARAWNTRRGDASYDVLSDLNRDGRIDVIDLLTMTLGWPWN